MMSRNTLIIMVIVLVLAMLGLMYKLENRTHTTVSHQSDNTGSQTTVERSTDPNRP